MSQDFLASELRLGTTPQFSSESLSKRNGLSARYLVSLPLFIFILLRCTLIVHAVNLR